jgi:hypothetical protein
LLSVDVNAAEVGMTLASAARAARLPHTSRLAQRPSFAPAAALPPPPLPRRRACAAAHAAAAGARCPSAALPRLRCARRRAAGTHVTRAASSALSDPLSPPPPPPPPSPPPLPLPARVALTLLIGASGAAAAASLRLPLPWMLGSLGATACASLAGAPLSLPSKLRLAWQTVIGVMLGAAFDPSLLSRLLRCSSTLAGLFVATAAATSLGALALRRFARYEPATAFFAAVPGGLNDMTLIGAELGGDERVIALSHTVRLVAVVSLLPFCLRTALAGGAGTTPVRARAYVRCRRCVCALTRHVGICTCAQGVVVAAAGGGLAAALRPLFSASAAPLLLPDALLLAACAALGPPLGAALRLPARALIGPMLLSAAAHLSGATSAKPPQLLLAAAQVVVGAAVGCRFVGVRPSALAGVASAAACVAGGQMVIAAAAAAAVSAASGTPWPLLLLSYSPGGITEMTLTAVALGYDAAFVATHHVARIVAITTLTPLAFALAARARGGKAARAEDKAA